MFKICKGILLNRKLMSLVFFKIVISQKKSIQTTVSF